MHDLEVAIGTGRLVAKKHGWCLALHQATKCHGEKQSRSDKRLKNLYYIFEMDAPQSPAKPLQYLIVLKEIAANCRRLVRLNTHGIPDMPFIDPNFNKDQFGVEGKTGLLTFGVLSPNKGIEHVIEALPAILGQHRLFKHCALSCVIFIVDMAVYKNNAFSRRLPDLVTEELVFVLSQKRSYEFKQLFEVVHDNLRQRNAANGGEEMLRLRAYEKLQNLVFRGAVKKNGKIYTGNSAALAAMAANAPHAGSVATLESNAVGCDNQMNQTSIPNIPTIKRWSRPTLVGTLPHAWPFRIMWTIS
jgi:hypothetical protein